jgi:hypothetical protein
MSTRGRGPRLLGLYPPAWRARYGDELAALLEAMSADGRVPLPVRLDVAFGAARERLRAAGLRGDGVPPAERMRAGVLLVLCAWALAVVGGAIVQKTAEHHHGTGLSAAAFAALVAAACVAGLLVLATIAAAVPSLVALLRAGGWPRIRRPILRAALVSALAAGATAGLVAWAHGLGPAQRDGGDGDGAYSAAFVAWAVLVTVALLAWTAAAVATARRLELPLAVLRAQTAIALGVSIAMTAITAATATWWASVAGVGLDARLVVATALMLAATLAGLAGTVRAVIALDDGGAALR